MRKFFHHFTLFSLLFLLTGWLHTIAQTPTNPCPAGITWTSQTSAANNDWTSVTYGNGLFVAVSWNGTGNRVMTSLDGVTWTSQNSAANSSWYSVTYGNGLFVAVGSSGTGNIVMTSPDGVTWTSQNSAANNSWTSVTYGNGLFVAVSNDGSPNQVMTSPDGITWISRNSAVDNYWSSVTYGNGLFVAVSRDVTGNRVMTSPDGITWTSRASAADCDWVSVTYGNGLFVAVAYSGTGNRVMTSPDGITWTSRAAATNYRWSSVTYGNGLFVAVSESGIGNRVMTSPDGINWTSQTSAADNNWFSVTYGNGLFVAVATTGTGNRVMTSSPLVLIPSVTIAANPGNSITSGTSVTFTATPTNGGTTPAYQWKKNGNNVGSNSVTYTDAALANGDMITCVLTSNNPCASTATATSTGITMAVTYPCPAGITWTSQTSAADNVWTSLTYGNGLFVAVAISGSGIGVMTSPDGITWTSRTSAANNQWNSVTYGNGLFVAVAATGTGNRVMTSPDGITWTSRTSAADNLWFSVTYGNGLFVAVSSDGTGNRVMTSPDGITWTSRTSAADNSWQSVTYGNGLFVAVSQSGAGNRVMTSSDGLTWTSRTSAADNQWNSVTFGNGVFVAVSQTGTSNRVMTSSDGITWTSRTSPADNNWNSVTYGNGLFVAVSDDGTGNRVMTSPDGINWTSRTSVADNDWYSVTYGNGKFVAVSGDGTGNRVMTSFGLVTPSVTIAANPGNTITSGTSVTFTATPTNGGTTPTYQWKKNNNNVGANSATYTDASLANNDSVWVVITSNNPCVSPNSVTSARIIMTVNPCVPITYLVTGGGAYCSGLGGVPVGLTNSETGVSYQLRLGTNNIGTPVNGTGTGINFGNQTAAGTYTVLATRTTGGCSATMTGDAVVSVIVSVTPSVSLSASTNSICVGTSVTFTASASNGGSSPLYDFRLNGVSVQSGSSSTYTNAALANNDIVNVLLTANNTCQTTPTAISSNIVMVANALPVVSITQLSNMPVSEDSLSVTGTPAGGTLSGPGFSGGFFRPWTVDTGMVTLTYTFTSAQGCSATATTTFRMMDEAIVWDGTQWKYGIPGSAQGSRDLMVLAGNSPAIPTGTACRNLVLLGGSLTHNLNNVLIINRNLRLRGGNMIGGGGTLRFTNAAAQINNSSNPLEFRADVEVPSGVNVSSIANFRLAPGSNIMAGTGTPNGGGTTSGTWTLVQKGSNQLSLYNAWSSPILGGTGIHISGTNNYRFNAATQSWELWDLNLVMTPGRGYIATASTNGWFRGVLHSGNYSYPVTFNSGLSSWNLIGNPYPSQLSLSDFLNANTILNGTAHFMKTNVNVNVVVTDYHAINGLTVTNIDIPVCQGFFVEANAPGNASFTNTMRRAGRTAFYQRSQNTAELVWLKGQNLNSPAHQSNPLIGFKQDATNGFDRMYDGRLLKGNSNIQFYSLLNNEAMTIQGLPTLTTTTIVPMGVEVTQAGSYELKLDSTTLSSSVNLYLEDLQTGIRHNLRNGSFIFNTTQAQSWTNRFRLVFQPLTTSTPTITNNQPLKLYAFDQTLVIDELQGRRVKEVRLTDLSGRVIENWQQPQDESRIELPTTAANGVYLMTVITTDSTVQTERVLITR